MKNNWLWLAAFVAVAIPHSKDLAVDAVILLNPIKPFLPAIMKNSFLPFIQSVFLTLAICAFQPQAQSAESISLTKDGVASHTIIVPSEANAIPSERFAAEELQKFLGEITGTKFTIVSEEGHQGPGIFIGATERSRQLGIDPDHFGEEEWVQRTEKGDLILSGGRPRGTLYGVYDFLETYAGCRWISPDTEVIPFHPDFSIPPLDTRSKPGFSWRETTLYPRHDNPKLLSKEDYALFLVRNRYNGGSYWLDESRFGFTVRFGRPSSSHTFFRYQEKWTDVKPEYFAMTEEGVRAPRMTGALGYDFCLTNLELRERIFGQLIEYIEEDRKESTATGLPAPTLYALSQNDTSSKYCRCPDCMAIAEREGSFSGTMIDFVNAIADKMAAVYPDVSLVTEAYQFTKYAPKTIRPRKNVVIRLPLLDREYGAAEIADVLRPITSTTNQAARELTENWAATVPGEQVFAWDYCQFRAPFRYPYDGTRKIMKNVEFWHRLGMTHIFIEQVGIDISFRPMREWLFFQKSVYPERNDDTLVGEFLDAYFGPAAGPMRNYYDLLAISTEAGSKKFYETQLGAIPYLTAEFFTQVNTWLEEAESLVSGPENAKFLRHVQLERVPVDSALAYLWQRYEKNPAWAGKREEVLQRYEKNKRILITTWATTVNSWVNSGVNAIDSEMAALRIKTPQKFEGLSTSMRLLAYDAPAKSLVEDKDAAAGRARTLGSGKAEDHTLPFKMRVYDSVTNESWDSLILEKVPQDESYHWYQVGTGPLGGNAVLWSNLYTPISLGWGAEPPPSNIREVWISLKFTGPTYMKGSTQPDQVLADQVLVVAPPVQ